MPQRYQALGQPGHPQAKPAQGMASVEEGGTCPFPVWLEQDQGQGQAAHWADITAWNLIGPQVSVQEPWPGPGATATPKPHCCPHA